MTSYVAGAPGGANLWATDAGWLPKSKLFGFHAGSGTLVTQFGKQGTEIYPALQYGNIADTSFALNGSTVRVLTLCVRAEIEQVLEGSRLRL